jgi:hypothetical protein
MVKKKNNNMIIHNGLEYKFDIDAMVKFIFKSNQETNSETEISEGYEFDKDSDDPVQVSKVLREIKSKGNSQNDSIRYDILKSFMIPVLNAEWVNTVTVEGDEGLEVVVPFGTQVALSTLIGSGFLVLK